MAYYSVAHLIQGEYDDGQIALFSWTKAKFVFIATDSTVIWLMSTNSDRIHEVRGGIVAHGNDDEDFIVSIDIATS